MAGRHFSEKHITESHETLTDLMGQITTWINEEKSKRTSRRARRKEKQGITVQSFKTSEESLQHPARHQRRDSDSSDSTLGLEELESILGKAASMSNQSSTARRKSQQLNRRVSLRKPTRQPTMGSSDTEHADLEAQVPSCDSTLDNTKTLMYLGNLSSSQTNLLDTSKVSEKELDAWWAFKFEIVRLSHTLRLKGWRQVPMEASREVEVERLSGALTNAVYVVSPPRRLLQMPRKESSGPQAQLRPRRQPNKLLLRIYGPQAEHLIDREAELQILCRLARQKIGPRLLGTFNNGRFEEYFNAHPLTAQDMRLPDTSNQIAKRMRELHSGIELLNRERDAGPFLWQSWDKWVNRCERIVKYIDAQVLLEDPETTSESSLRKRGLICGVEWPLFRKAVQRYRKHLSDQYGGSKHIREQLVFAHNDTQYGNILRLDPPGESPLLLPQNKHRQLVVIDFEYANANVIGVEFANHFTEWCYNYHDPSRPWALNTAKFPRPDEQHRFIKAYLEHRPHFVSDNINDSVARSNSSSGFLTGRTSSSQLALNRQSSSISSFSLDGVKQPPLNRTSSNISNASIASTTTNTTLNAADDAAASSSDPAEVDLEVRRLAHEARLWRAANSAFWVAWGVVQARVPGLEEQAAPTTDETPPPGSPTNETANVDTSSSEADTANATEPGRITSSGKANKTSTELEIEENEEEQESEEHFDYLAYAQDRALFFWADCVAFGVVDLEKELPTELQERVRSKMIAY
ncbi:MAG: hypothetical protein M1828_001330 [Chrysothrix sp. TS-e1954]|nr:MAG: hypothetical protein M1828_001330 [Chrysothrix sp. TS-e1954]